MASTTSASTWQRCMGHCGSIKQSPSAQCTPCYRRPARHRTLHTQACHGDQQQPARREVVLHSLLVLPALLPELMRISNETSPEPPKVGQCADCIGEVDGTLNSCGSLPSCISTFDDRPAHFVAPWSYDGQQSRAQAQLSAAIEAAGGTAQVLQQNSSKRAGYIRATLPSVGGGLLRSSGTLDVEFVFSGDTDNTVRVALRAVPRVQPRLALLDGDGGVQNTLESLRLTLGWESVPVLRNRRRVLLFGESPFDDYGPTPPAGGVDYGKGVSSDL